MTSVCVVAHKHTHIHTKNFKRKENVNIQTYSGTGQFSSSTLIPQPLKSGPHTKPASQPVTFWAFVCFCQTLHSLFLTASLQVNSPVWNADTGKEEGKTHVQHHFKIKIIIIIPLQFLGKFSKFQNRKHDVYFQYRPCSNSATDLRTWKTFQVELESWR